MQKSRRLNRQPRRGGGNNSNPPQSGSSHNPRHQSNSSRPPRPPPSYTPVPAYSSITVGHGVSIILKQDQPTGRQVTGIVAELLTRGDHPRGVKVRLRDGRVGRVQALVSEPEGQHGEDLVGGADAGLGRNGESGGITSVSANASHGRGGRRRGFRHERDIREDDEYFYDEDKNKARNLGYFAALEEADKKHEEQRGWGGQAGERLALKSEEGGQLAICPVCGTFEGDETAVAHHVEAHFAEGA